MGFIVPPVGCESASGSPASWTCLSVNIMNRIGDKGQSWWSPTPTENVFVFVSRIWTQLSLWLDKDLKMGTTTSVCHFKQHNHILYKIVKISTTCNFYSSQLQHTHQ